MQAQASHKHFGFRTEPKQAKYFKHVKNSNFSYLD